MTKNDVDEIGQRVSDLLKKYSIGFKSFDLVVVVSPEYYEAIKDNFPVPEYRDPSSDLNIIIRYNDFRVSIQAPEIRHRVSSESA